jgi:hypothetical protein
MDKEITDMEHIVEVNDRITNLDMATNINLRVK